MPSHAHVSRSGGLRREIAALAARMMAEIRAEAGELEAAGWAPRLVSISVGDVAAADAVQPVQIGERARHPHHPVIAPRRQGEALGHACQEVAAFGIGAGDLFQNANGVLRVGVFEGHVDDARALGRSV